MISMEISLDDIGQKMWGADGQSNQRYSMYSSQVCFLLVKSQSLHLHLSQSLFATIQFSTFLISKMVKTICETLHVESKLNFSPFQLISTIKSCFIHLNLRPVKRWTSLAPFHHLKWTSTPKRRVNIWRFPENRGTSNSSISMVCSIYKHLETIYFGSPQIIRL